jgi:hypothetical protein
VHIAPSCTGSVEGSDHFGSYVRSLSLHFFKRLFPELEPMLFLMLYSITSFIRNHYPNYGNRSLLIHSTDKLCSICRKIIFGFSIYANFLQIRKTVNFRLSYSVLDINVVSFRDTRYRKGVPILLHELVLTIQSTFIIE